MAEAPVDGEADVLVVGGGPAGLTCATWLRRLGVGRVVLVDRDEQPGGVPRHTDHPGFGARDLRRVLSGPTYAARLVAAASEAGVLIRSETTATRWLGPTTLGLTSPSGVAATRARAVVLATGCRERPRSARLVPGDRPAGVLTTGRVQQALTLYPEGRGAIGRRAVIVGAEHVSFSAVLSLAHAGCGVAAMVTELPRDQTFWPLRLATAGRHRVPVLASRRVTAIRGRGRVEAVEVAEVRADGTTGETTAIACDTVVFTGDWVPDHDLARAGEVALAATRGPSVDQCLRTSRPGVFAAGNALHGAEAADVAARAGRHAAERVRAYLDGPGSWPAAAVAVRHGEALRWVTPDRLAAGDGAPPRGRLLTRVAAFTRGRLVVRQGDRVLHAGRRRTLVPNRSVAVPVPWLGDLDPDGPAVEVTVEASAR